MKIKLKHKPSKKEYEHLLNRVVETIDETIEMAKEERTEYSVGIVQGHWETLDSLKNIMIIDDVKTKNDMDKLVEDYYNKLNELRNEINIK